MEWVSVNDRLPEKGERVLICTNLPFVCEGYLGRENNRFVRNNTYIVESSLGKVTHWQPLPEPPKEDKK